MIVRDAGLNDLDDLVRLWREMMALHYTCNRIFKMKENASDLYTNYAKSVIGDKTKKAFVAEESNGIIGYVFCEIVEQPPVYEETRIGNITEISVEGHERRNGIGKRWLMNVLIGLRKMELKELI